MKIVFLAVACLVVLVGCENPARALVEVRLKTKSQECASLPGGNPNTFVCRLPDGSVTMIRADGLAYTLDGKNVTTWDEVELFPKK